ncbi:MAG: hypothetical protein DME26_10115 [Verrucomicrobia bacterium]|nr:MAG: hypothetical protein DME26_10115 [Verrucomicrobiota bacterium]
MNGRHLWRHPAGQDAPRGKIISLPSQNGVTENLNVRSNFPLPPPRRQRSHEPVKDFRLAERQM